MSTGKFELTIPPDQKVLTVREGVALELKPPQKIKLQGDIYSPENFAKKRLITEKPDVWPSMSYDKEFTDFNIQAFHAETAIAIFDKENLSIIDRTNDYYGGYLIAESISNKSDADLIAASKDLFEACTASRAIFEGMGITEEHRIVGEQFKKLTQAIKKATTPF